MPLDVIICNPTQTAAQEHKMCCMRCRKPCYHTTSLIDKPAIILCTQCHAIEFTLWKESEKKHNAKRNT